MEDVFKQVLTARVYDLAQRTPLELARNLSAQVDNQVYLKREDQQPSFSFKVRGAANKVAHLSPAERQAGILCASAGNHAQGVALAARHVGVAALVVMPVTTPRIKVQAVKSLGAEVVLHGDSYSEAASHCQALQRETRMTFVHPFDDALVIAGQGTVGQEILQQCPDADAVFVPVGGGGLIGGISALIKALSPRTRVIGVQPVDSNAMQLSLQAGRRVELDHVGMFADGVAVKQVGVLTLALAQAFVDEIVTVTTDQICSAIKAIYEDTRSIMEPAGALGVAGLKHYLALHPAQGQRLV
ncbi:MAG TPA: threonine ammonia-lyase, biosynthetic, partial [bacterium]|nr:threonine ammonia-lyase, biosynthetic [bacterium]